MFEQKAVGSLVVPFGLRLVYGPLSVEFMQILLWIIGFFSGDGSLEHGRNVNALLISKRFKGSVMAVRLIFSRP